MKIITVIVLLLVSSVSSYSTYKCIHQGGQSSRSSGLRNVLSDLEQHVLLDFVPRRLESHYSFADSRDRDPFLWAFIRPFEDYGHERILNAIRNAWFAVEADGVLVRDLSAETYVVNRELRDSILNKTKEEIRNQLARCPESIILLRRVQQQGRDMSAIAIPIVDYIADVSQITTDFFNTVQGNKAIYILEIVFPREGKEFHTLLQEDRIQHNTISYLTHSQKIRDTAMREYFGTWRAMGTRLWVTWMLELSQATKLKMYRRKLRALKQELQNIGYHINFSDDNEEQHCNNLSPHSKGINEMLDFLTVEGLKQVLKSCPEDEKTLNWVTHGTSINCTTLWNDL